MDSSFKVTDLGFQFTYLDKTYTKLTISKYGYACLSNNKQCDSMTRPSPHDILVGLNYDLNPSRSGSGQIYYQYLNAIDSKFAPKTYVNLLDSTFVPNNIFIITFDNVLASSVNSTSKVSFRIFLLTNSEKSFVTFKYTSCPTDLNLLASSGLNYNNNGKLEEILIAKDKQCTLSNVKQSGIWVTEVTSYSLGNKKNTIFKSR